MVYKAEINPRDFNGYFDMIYKLQDACFQLYGANFEVTKIAMGQLSDNSEMCWFEGYVDDNNIKKVVDVTPHHKTAAEYLRAKTFYGTDRMLTDDAVECIRLDRIGCFADSPNLRPKEINVHIESLGTFHISDVDKGLVEETKKAIINALLKAINDFEITGNGR